MSRIGQSCEWADIDRRTLARTHFVYRVFDANGGLLYVGRTKRPAQRWREHVKSGAAWVELAASCRMFGPLDYPTAHALERKAISRESPAYNVRGLLGTTDPRSVANWGATA